jgi:hypothetical protein
MRHAIGGKVRVILRNYELAPLADVAVVEVAPLAEDYAVLQRIVPSQFGGLFKVSGSPVNLQFFTAMSTGVLLPDIGPVFYILRKFLRTHNLGYPLIL